MSDLSFNFELDLYRAVIRFKQDHPGVLEARTNERRERREAATDRTQVPEQRISAS